TRATCAAALGELRHLGEKLDLASVGGREQVAAPIEIDAIARRARNLFDEIDAAIHERGHLPVGAGPPVAVSLGRFVGGERERIARFHKRYVLEAVHDRELISRGDARNAGATDDNFRRSIHAASSAARSIASMSASDMPK